MGKVIQFPLHRTRPPISRLEAREAAEKFLAKMEAARQRLPGYRPPIIATIPHWPRAT